MANRVVKLVMPWELSKLGEFFARLGNASFAAISLIVFAPVAPVRHHWRPVFRANRIGAHFSNT